MITQRKEHKDVNIMSNNVTFFPAGAPSPESTMLDKINNLVTITVRIQETLADGQ